MDLGDRKDNKEFIKERAHLETSVKGLKEKFKKNMDVHEKDNIRIMNQNVDLISEINDLKRDKKNLKDERKRQKDLAKKKKELQSLMPEAAKLEREIEINEDEKEKRQ
eukprot:TRINITY_DN56604_c0_g2_i1.p2 TRINITY_DN56604_c0_g2~~TRINITY_DN56604_c0_g2_i1.p2  ORF type:complete len:108 (+),score=5.97 TRINITY_DN56604_c0_g2_i1:166-489(+)